MATVRCKEKDKAMAYHTCIECDSMFKMYKGETRYEQCREYMEWESKNDGEN